MRKTKDKIRAETLEWCRKYRRLTDPLWSAYRAGKAGVDWLDFLAARRGQGSRKQSAEAKKRKA